LRCVLDTFSVTVISGPLSNVVLFTSCK
jgi:hypothetical protein